MHYDLTDQTRKVINGHAREVATEMDVHDSYLYQMLSGVGNDTFSQFKRLYAASVRAGCDVSPWDAAFAEIRNRYACKDAPDEIACLAEKIARDADTTAKIVTALEDGKIDDDEKPALRAAIQRERDVLDLLDAAMSGNVRGNILPDHAKAAAAQRRGSGNGSLAAVKKGK